MKEELAEILPQLLPADFFSIECDIEYVAKTTDFVKKMEKHQLVSTSDLLFEEHFADMALSWNEEGIMGEVNVSKAFEEAKYPEYQEGDSIELFLDTRNIKTAGYATKFCHHFILLPTPVNGLQAKEVTRFRSEDAHLIAEELPIKLQVEFNKKSYSLKFFIAKTAFCGYEPATCSSLGFTYKINRANGKPQHFSVSSLYYNIEQQPSLWATLHLKK